MLWNMLWNQQQNKLALLLLLLLLLQPLVSVPPSSLQCTLSHTVAVRRTARMQCISNSTDDDAPPSNVHLRVIHAITSAIPKVRRTAPATAAADSTDDDAPLVTTAAKRASGQQNLLLLFLCRRVLGGWV
jgi:hypothetical protein